MKNLDTTLKNFLSQKLPFEEPKTDHSPLRLLAELHDFNWPGKLFELIPVYLSKPVELGQILSLITQYYESIGYVAVSQSLTEPICAELNFTMDESQLRVVIALIPQSFLLTICAMET